MDHALKAERDRAAAYGLIRLVELADEKLAEREQGEIKDRHAPVRQTASAGAARTPRKAVKE